MNLKLGKDSIWFKPEKHVYVNKDEIPYTSVTKFIGWFKQPYDSNFWSTYKAVERILQQNELHPLWKDLKMKYLKSDDKSLFLDSEKLHKALGSHWTLVEEPSLSVVKTAILKEWEIKSEASKVKGSAYHDKEEKFYRDKYNFPPDFSGYDISYPNLLSTRSVEYPELRLYNHEYKLAGSSDLNVVHKNGTVDITDYKTSQRIEFDSFKNPFTGSQQMMKEPLSMYPDCNFIHYSLQISTYAWMLEELGYNINPSGLKIEHIIFKEDMHPFKKEHPVIYMRDSVIKMLNYAKETGKLAQ